MLINQENLIKAGYKQFNSYLNQSRTYLASYQKKVRDENGIKYYITIAFYDLRELDKTAGIQFQAEAQFCLKDGFTFEVSGFDNKEITIEELESFYGKIWDGMDCEYQE